MKFQHKGRSIVAHRDRVVPLGVESDSAPTVQQVAYGRAAVQAGADLVAIITICHRHRKYTYMGKCAYIVYGLGTIVSAVERPDDIDTFIYRIPSA